MPRIKWSAARGAVALSVAVLALAAVGAVVLRGDRLSSLAAKPAETPPPAEAPPPPPPEVAPLSRDDMIAAAQEAGASYAAGEPAGGANSALVDRRFVVRLPFGCRGPSNSPGADPARWAFDATRRTVKLAAEPQSWAQTDWISKLAGPGDFEAIDGFWIARPWLKSDLCPKRQASDPDAPPPSPAAPLAPPPQSIGLAMFLQAADTRASQRGLRLYQAAFRPKATDIPAVGEQGFQLVLTGRVRGYGDGQPIHCYSPSMDDRPVCLVAVEIDTVAFEDPASGATLAEWRNG